MKSATEMESLIQRNATEINSSASRDTTVGSSPTKALQTFSACTDEFSQVQVSDQAYLIFQSLKNFPFG